MTLFWPNGKSYSSSGIVKGKISTKKRGTNVILASKIAHEPTSVPPQYILMPNPEIMTSAPSTGLANIIEDKDGFMRRYFVFLPLLLSLSLHY